MANVDPKRIPVKVCRVSFRGFVLRLRNHRHRLSAPWPPSIPERPCLLARSELFLDSWNSLINDYYAVKLPNSKVFIGEHGVKLGGLLDNTQYGGIYVSESVLRLVTNPHISYLAGYRFTNGLFTPSQDYGILLEDAYQGGNTVDTTSLNFTPYYSTPSDSLKVIDGAVNQAR